MYGKSFTYNGRSSEEFHIIISGFQTMDIPLNLKRTTTASAINQYRKQVSTYGVNYDSVLSFTLYIMKDPCLYESHEDLRFSRQDIRNITKWLTSPLTPRLFHMTNYDKDTDPEYDYFGMFTNIETADINTYVLNCTFECNTPYALSSEQVVTITDATGVITNPSDELEDYVYPIIRITPKESGNHSITLRNLSDGNKYIRLKNMQLNQIVTLDCQKMTLKNSFGGLLPFDYIDTDELNYIYWFRLLNGYNNISITGGAEVEFTFRYPVKVGAY